MDRAFQLLFLLAPHPQGVPLQQLAADAGCSKSTAHRLLATLQALGVADQDPATKRYRPGPRLAELAPPGAEPDLRRLALPLMRQLRDDTEETVTLHLVQGDGHVVVEQLESPHEIRRILPMGQPVPLLTGATARAILAAMPSAEAAAAVERASAESGVAAEPSRAPAAALAAELADIRARGFSLSPGERLAGGTAMSAAILDREGRVIAALSVSGPRFRFTVARAQRFGPSLAAAARRLSKALGAV